MKAAMKVSLSQRLFSVFNVLFFSLMALMTLYPLWYVIMYSLSNPDSIRFSSLYLVPINFTIDTYKYVLSQPLVFTAYKNTIIITVLSTFLTVYLSALTAYPLSRGKFIGRNFIFKMLFFTMLFGGGLIPTYMVIKALGWIDHLVALIVPGALNVYFILIMIRFFKSIPDSLFEAARMDGCNEAYVLFKIVLPMSTAVLTAIGLFSAVGVWNDYFNGVIYMNHSDRYPLQVVLYSMLTSNLNLALQNRPTVTPQTMKMATVVVALLPIMLVYPFVQKHFMQGVLLGSVKG